MKEDRPGRLALLISVRMMIESNHRIVMMECGLRGRPSAFLPRN